MGGQHCLLSTMSNENHQLPGNANPDLKHRGAACGLVLNFGPHRATLVYRTLAPNYSRPRPTNGRSMPSMTSATMFLTAACALLPKAGAIAPTAAPTIGSSSSMVRFTHVFFLSHLMVPEHTHTHTQSGGIAGVLVLIVVCCCCFNCCCSDGQFGFLFGNRRQRPVEDSTGGHQEDLEILDDAAAPKRAPKEAKWVNQFEALMVKQVVMTWRNLLGTVRVFVGHPEPRFYVSRKTSHVQPYATQNLA